MSDDIQTDVLEMLTTAVRRDVERGGTGCRTTAEVGERCGLTTAQARRVLERLFDDGKVDGYDDSDEGASRPSYSWRLKGFDVKDDLIVTASGEPMPEWADPSGYAPRRSA